MKKAISICISVMLALISAMNISISAFANTFETATLVSTDTSTAVSISGTSDKTVYKWLKYDCTLSGYYDIKINSASTPKAAAEIGVYDADKKLVNFASNSNLEAEFCFATYMNSGSTYYIKFSVYASQLKFDATISAHNHTFTDMQTVRAVADDDNENRLYGYTSYTCQSCGYTYTAFTYAPPAKLICTPAKMIYTGYELAPSVTVKDENGVVISNENYTIALSDNILPGRAFATVSFNNEAFVGELTASFIIKPAKATATSLTSTKPRQFTFKWSKDTTSTGYEYQYSTSKKFYKSKTKTVEIKKSNKSTATVKNLVANKKYYVRIRAYKAIDDTKYYGAWSDAVSVKVKS